MTRSTTTRRPGATEAAPWERRRPRGELTLAPETWARLEALATSTGAGRGRVVEAALELASDEALIAALRGPEEKEQGG